MNNGKKILFLIGDGDNIRHTVESYLFRHQFEELNKFSEVLSKAILNIKEMIIADMEAKVILAGGDDILFTIHKGTYDKEQVINIMKYFQSHTGCTMSFGVGENIESAYLNLMKAKATGKAKIID